DKASNTLDNAIFSRQVVDAERLHISKILFVCKAHHARRALLTYQTTFLNNVQFIVVPIIDERDIRKDNWFLDEAKIKIVMSEVEKVGRYFPTFIPKWAAEIV
ncbi:MAG: ElyC/SanA/YdcF family protein, partial [Sedimentisphaerales bacterium]|nr:ElyC/SanA/YdcF family protein [Sedimentisphaerales bacterium]